jgi:hypothetical protein
MEVYRKKICAKVGPNIRRRYFCHVINKYFEVYIFIILIVGLPAVADVLVVYGDPAVAHVHAVIGVHALSLVVHAVVGTHAVLKRTVSRDFLPQVLIMNHLPPGP